MSTIILPFFDANVKRRRSSRALTNTADNRPFANFFKDNKGSFRKRNCRTIIIENSPPVPQTSEQQEKHNAAITLPTGSYYGNQRGKMPTKILPKVGPKRQHVRTKQSRKKFRHTQRNNSPNNAAARHDRADNRCVGELIFLSANKLPCKQSQDFSQNKR